MAASIQFMAMHGLRLFEAGCSPQTINNCLNSINPDVGPEILDPKPEILSPNPLTRKPWIRKGGLAALQVAEDIDDSTEAPEGLGLRV